MSGLTRRPPSPTAAGRHARLRHSADLRTVCLTTLIALVVQFVLGMILNLYATVPSSDAHAGYLQEILNGPAYLTVHVLLGIALICAAVLLLIRAISGGNRAIASLAATGLAAILGAFAAGEIFVRNGQDDASLWMAILTGAALMSYIGALNLMRVTARQPVFKAPQTAAPAGQRSDDFWSGPGTRSPFPGTSPHPYSRPQAAPPGFVSRGTPARVTRSAASKEASRGGWPTMPPQNLPYRKPPTDDFPRITTDDGRGKPPW
jgi:hypothetical protein